MVKTGGDAAVECVWKVCMLKWKNTHVLHDWIKAVIVPLSKIKASKNYYIKSYLYVGFTVLEKVYAQPYEGL